MWNRLLVFLFGGILICSGPVSGLDPRIPVDRYVMDIWRLEDGLPQNTITALLQTSDGYLWIGTGNGIARYDGFRFQVIKYLNPQSSINNVLFFYEDREGNLWIASDHFFTCYNPAKFDFQVFRGIAGSIINLYQDSRGRIWACSTFGLFYLSGSEFTRMNGPHNAQKIMEDSSGQLWLFTIDDGIWHSDESGFRMHLNYRKLIFGKFFDAVQVEGDWILATDRGVLHLAEDFTLPPGSEEKEQTGKMYIRGQFLVDRDRRIWFGSDRGVYYQEDQENTWVQVLMDSIQFMYTKSMLQDQDGNIWIYTEKGLVRIIPGRNPEVQRCSSADQEIFSLYEDRWRNLWMGMRRGLARLCNPRLRNFTEQADGLPCSLPRIIYKDRNGNIRVSGSDCLALYSFRNGRFTSDFDGHGTIIPYTVLCQDLEGHYWAIWTDGSLRQFAQNPKNPLQSINFGDMGNPKAMAWDREGSLWLGFNNGLLRWYGGRIENCTIQSGLAGIVITDMLVDREGALWIATDSGIFIRKDRRFSRAFAGSILPRFLVVDIFEDREGTIWLGAYGGLFRCRQGSLFHYTIDQGLLDNDILAIQEDDSGYLWLNSNHGIMRVAKRELQELAEAKISQVHPLLFDRNDGMRNIEGNASSQSSIRDQLGNIWFCTMGGLVVIDPAKIRFNPEPPPVYIEKVVADGRDMLGAHLSIPAGTQRLELHYTAIDFHNPRNVRFQYRLQGYDSRWIEARSRGDRSVDYTNLPPGTYRFHVKACNSDGVWNREGASLSLTIAPFFWQTLWFRIPLTILLVSLAYAAMVFAKRFFFLLSFWRQKRLVGHYVLEEIIGYGSMAVIFRAHHILSKKTKVAVKILKKEHLRDNINLKRFKQEGALIDMLDHPHIVKVVSRGEQEDTFFIIMEHLTGTTLSRKIQSQVRISLDEARYILIQLAEVLKEIHLRGIIHRDLKPANIMLIEKDGRNNYAKLLDFGVASAPYRGAESEYGFYAGALAYIAPEQVKNMESAASDIYSLGMIAYEMLASVRPFHECRPPDLLEAVLSRVPVHILEICPDLPAGTANLVMAMLEKDPHARPTIDLIESELKKSAM